MRGVSLARKSSGVAGSAAFGVVTSVPSGESDFAVNDSVFVVGNGTWADEVVVSKSGVSKVANVSAEEAAALPGFVSAWALLHNFVALKAGDVVVQTSGKSAVGAAVAQVGKALGLTVVSLSEEDLAGAKLGAKLQESGKIKLVLAGHSGKHLSLLQRSIAPGGSLVAYNGVYEPLSASSEVQMPISNMIFQNTSVQGFDLAAWVHSDPAAYRGAVKAVLALVQDKKVSLKPTHVFAQADFKKALQEVTSTGAAAVLKH